MLDHCPAHVPSLLSQRRRWINSTVHNMFELLKVHTMWGVCCVSMKVVVFIILWWFTSIDCLILYGIIMGVQIIVFILFSRWEYLWWFAIYFGNMDDFSWGKTRSVGCSGTALMICLQKMTTRKKKMSRTMDTRHSMQIIQTCKMLMSTAWQAVVAAV